MRGVRARHLAALTLVGGSLILTGCGQSVTGTLIGVRQPVPATSPVPADTLGGVQLALQQEMADAEAVSSSRENTLANDPFKLTSNLSLLQSERLSALQALGAHEVQLRLADLQNLYNDVATDRGLPASLQATLEARISSYSSSLSALGAHIAGDQMVDQARTDVVNIATQFRIQGLIEPQIHLLAAAGHLLTIAQTYQAEQQQLAATIASLEAQGQNVGNAPALVADMQNQIYAMVADAQSAIGSLTPLQPSGYPGTTPVLNQSRIVLGNGQTASAAAGNDALNAKAIVG